MVKRLFELILLVSLATAPSARAEDRCERIVSLAPSITEVLFEVGLGQRLVGVTRFCRYPAAATQVPKVGGFYDTSLEAIMLRRPTRVFALPEHRTITEGLRRLNIPVTEVHHGTITGIKESIRTIGEVCGVAARAAETVQGLVAEEQTVQARCAHHRAHPQRVMVVVGRTREGSKYTGLYISGKDGFYSEALTLVGGENVNTRDTVAIPTVSAEGIRALRPDAIIEIVNVDDAEHPERLEAFWRDFPELPAVARKAVLLIGNDYASIPGPRYVQLLKRMADGLCRER